MGRVSTCQKNCNTIDLRRAHPSIPSHYLSQCWIVVNWTPKGTNIIQWNFYKKYKTFHLRKCVWKYLLSNGGYWSRGDGLKSESARPPDRECRPGLQTVSSSAPKRCKLGLWDNLQSEWALRPPDKLAYFVSWWREPILVKQLGNCEWRRD